MTAGAAAVPAGPALGIYARSSDAPERAGERKKRGRAARSARLRLQRVAGGLLWQADMPLEMKQHRTCTCYRRRKSETVEVLRNKETGRAHFIGVETCNNVWTCPICSEVITDERRKEIQDGITRWRAQGGEVYLMTLTFPHSRRDVLAELMEQLAAALDHFRTSRAWAVHTKKRCGRIGSIRALEVTYGLFNGWHPHVHELVFAAPGQLDALRDLLQGQWVDSLLKVGAAERSQVSDMLTGKNGQAVAFDIRGGDFAADYVAKFGHEPALKSLLEAEGTWDAASEVSRGASKLGKVSTRFTPFTLLVVYDKGGIPRMSRAQAGEAFREFAAAFKGERQLYWSPRLRKKLGMEDETDDELMERTLDELQPKVESCGELDAESWKLVIAHDAREPLLWAAEEYGADGVRMMLAELRRRPPTHSARATESRRWG